GLHVGEPDLGGGAVTGAAADLEAVRERRDQGQAEPEAGLSGLVGPGLEAVSMVGDRDLELALSWNGGPLGRPRLGGPRGEDDVVAGLGDHGLQVRDPLARESHCLADAGNRLAYHEDVLGGRWKV